MPVPAVTPLSSLQKPLSASPSPQDRLAKKLEDNLPALPSPGDEPVAVPAALLRKAATMLRNV